MGHAAALLSGSFDYTVLVGRIECTIIDRREESATMSELLSTSDCLAGSIHSYSCCTTPEIVFCVTGPFSEQKYPENTANLFTNNGEGDELPRTWGKERRGIAA
jgi:hypothetical protein